MTEVITTIEADKIEGLECTLLKVNYVNQDIANLRFGVYSRVLEPDLFRIFRRRVIERERYRAHLWIIGSSHVLNLQTEQACLGEVLTSSDTSLPSDARINLIEDFEDSHCEHNILGEISYKAKFALRRYSEEEFLQEQSLLFAQEVPCRLAYRFPQREGLVAAPVTVIDVVRAEEDILEIRTLHSYVENLTMVLTHSVAHIMHPSTPSSSAP